MKNKLDVIIGCAIALFILGAILFALMAPKFEADAFNKCTGGNATYMTALYTELRVQDCKQ